MNFLKRLRTPIFAFLAAFSVFSAPLFATGSWNPIDITRMNNAEPPSKNPRDQGWKLGAVKCTFDPSSDTTMRTVAAHSCTSVIPKNSYVTKAYYKVVTTFTSAADSATIAIKIASANDIVSAIAISDVTNPWDAAKPVLGIPIGDMATAIAITADASPTFTVAVQALTAGKLILWVEFIYYGDV